MAIRRTNKLSSPSLGYIGLSQGKGRGVFASRDIKQGEIVEISPCIYLPYDTNVLVESSVLADYVFGATRDSDEGYVLAFGYASMYNHSKKANCSYVVSEKTVVIVADKTIKENVELTIDYGWDPNDR